MTWFGDLLMHRREALAATNDRRAGKACQSCSRPIAPAQDGFCDDECRLEDEWMGAIR